MITKPKILIKSIISQIKKDKLIRWDHLSKIFNTELVKKNEFLYDTPLLVWGKYTKGYGITVQKNAPDDKKLLVAIYAYRLFLNKTSGDFSLYKSDIDPIVRDDIRQLFKGVNRKTRKRLQRISKVSDFKKLFTNNYSPFKVL